MIEDKITNAEIDKIEVNEHLGTQEDGDYIALIHLKFKPKNSNETTLKLIDLYNNEIGAQLAKQKEIQEVTIFLGSTLYQRGYEYCKSKSSTKWRQYDFQQYLDCSINEIKYHFY
ncbi:hypothetical protein ACT7DN_26835 [Bacillus paranthracis]